MIIKLVTVCISIYIKTTIDRYLKQDSRIKIGVKTFRNMFYTFKTSNNIVLPNTM